ncbi:hypothetical protein F5Y12DRAFT_688923 [Xylaria sp. FL1777]|nr:hypothetical protein F5Y12DRAFT_688923 [Xylaria sp. FL1777]
MDPGVAGAAADIDDENLHRFGSQWRVTQEQSCSILTTSGSPAKNGIKGKEPEPERENDEEEQLSPLIDPEFHRLITEWRLNKTREDYKPYSEVELRRFGEQWKIGIPKYAPTEREVREKLKELEVIYANLSRIIDKFYELAWTRKSQDYWNHIWLTLHLAGATVEDVWEITRNKWPRLLKEIRPFGPKEVEKLRNFIEISGAVILQCDSVLCDFDFEKERACCLKLYRVLRAFPIAPRWKRITSWEAQDKLIRYQGFGLLNRLVNWI